MVLHAAATVGMSIVNHVHAPVDMIVVSVHVTGWERLMWVSYCDAVVVWLMSLAIQVVGYDSCPIHAVYLHG